MATPGLLTNLESVIVEKFDCILRQVSCAHRVLGSNTIIIEAWFIWLRCETQSFFLFSKKPLKKKNCSEKYVLFICFQMIFFFIKEIL